MPRDLSRLLRPQSIAVFGAGWAANVVTQCDKIGFAGDIWPIHPTRSEIAGRPCFASLDDLPRSPDATFIGVNRHATIEIVDALAKMDAGGAICFASGWSETGDHDLQAALVDAAKNMPILGPNCYGVLNMLDGAVIWPDQHGAQPCESGVAILSQSSNIAINLTMQTRGLPVAYVACVGNAAQTGMAEMAEAMLADPRVTALGIYAEGFADAAALARIAQEARLADKGVVILKSGRSVAGAAAAASHTAVLSGVHAASQAFLRQAGIGSVSTPAALIETLKILHAHGPLSGRRVCAVCCSGGEAGLVADIADGGPLDFAPLGDDQKQVLADVLGPMITLANPLDYQTFIWGDLEKTASVFTAALRDYDAGLYIIDVPRQDICDPASFEPALKAIAMAAKATRKPAFAVASLPENINEARARDLMAAGVVPLNGLETALAAVAAASTPAVATWQPWQARPARATVTLDEADSKSLLAQAGVAVPRGVKVDAVSDLPAAAKGLKAPYAVKGLGFAHKTEAGAVKLGVTDLTAIVPIAQATSYLIEEMIDGAVAELIIGVQRDPVYGATVLIGFGGVAAELLDDTQTLVLPVQADDIRTALSQLKLAPLLDGYRGRPKADVKAVISTVLALQDCLATNGSVTEIEINPLVVRQSGAVAVDALIMKETI